MFPAFLSCQNKFDGIMCLLPFYSVKFFFETIDNTHKHVSHNAALTISNMSVFHDKYASQSAFFIPTHETNTIPHKKIPPLMLPISVKNKPPGNIHIRTSEENCTKSLIEARFTCECSGNVLRLSTPEDCDGMSRQ